VTDALVLSYVSDLQREVRSLREEVGALRAAIERMERDLRTLLDSLGRF
jgi:HAMP domain-containing protein